jgi:hypothetical protein
MRKHFALMATVAALAVTPAFAQTTAPKPDSQPAPQAQPSTPSTQAPAATTTQAPSKAMSGEKFVNTQTSDQWLASDLMDMRIMGSGDENIGSISDLLVDKDGKIVAAVVGVGGFLGIGQKNVAISFDALDVTQDKDGNPQARLTLTKQDLEKAPEFKTAAAVKRESQRPPAASPATSPAKPAAPRN